MSAPDSVELVRQGEALPARQMVAGALTIQEIIAQKKLVAQCVSELMKEDEHFGVIPGTGKRKDANGNELPPKPSLLKPGADLLCSLFQLEADYSTEEAIRTPTFIYYRLKCTLTSAATGIKRGSGLGSCNSREEKYARAAAKKCPKCGKETIFRSKKEERDGTKGWFCWTTKGGCGENYRESDPAITEQDTGVKDPSDLDNTILKMAAKRARIDAVLTVTGASDFFTQDVEDLTNREAEYIPPQRGATEGSRQTPAPRSAFAPPAGSQNGKRELPNADTIIHDGIFITDAQLKKLHTLRREAGGSYCTDEGDAKSLWRMKVLGAYRDQERNRLTSSKQLSKTQASHLIERLERHIQKTRARAEEQPDLGAVIPDAADLATELRRKDISEQSLCSEFGVDAITELSAEDTKLAMGLVLAYGTDRYEQVLQDTRDRIAVAP